MADNDIVARADANYFQSWRVINANAEGGEALERDGMLLTSSALPVAWLNLVFVTRPLADPDAAIAAAAAFYDARNLPFVVRIREGVDPAAERACEAHGMPFSDVVPGLVMAPIAKAPSPPAQLEIRVVAGEAALRDHRAVMASSFELPGGVPERLLREEIMGVDGCELYVGYLDGASVASSALFAFDGVAGIENVGCVADARRQGLGEAMTWHAVRRGSALGCDMGSLQSSDMGRPIYERMGFRLVAPYRTFVRQS
jgi:hypothetical protein